LADGAELLVDCAIGKPRCRICRLNMASPDALRYHMMMTHTAVTPLTTLISPTKPSTSSTSPSSPTSPTLSLKRLSLPSAWAPEGEVKRVRVKVQKELEMMEDTARVGVKEEEEDVRDIEERLTAALDYVNKVDEQSNTSVGWEARLLEPKVGEEELGVGKVEEELRGVVLGRVLEHLGHLDRLGVFREPVDLELVPDYLACIARPMDLATMRTKAGRGAYPSLEALELDFALMVSNCLTYNMADTKFYRAAARMQVQGARVFQQARVGELGSLGEQISPGTAKAAKAPRRVAKGGRRRSKGKEEGEPKVKKVVKEDKVTKDKAVKEEKVVKEKAGGSDSGVSTTAMDSDTSNTSEFAVPSSAPR